MYVTVFATLFWTVPDPIISPPLDTTVTGSAVSVGLVTSPTLFATSLVKVNLIFSVPSRTSVSPSLKSNVFYAPDIVNVYLDVPVLSVALLLSVTFFVIHSDPAAVPFG